MEERKKKNKKQKTRVISNIGATQLSSDHNSTWCASLHGVKIIDGLLFLVLDGRVCLSIMPTVPLRLYTKVGPSNHP